NTFKVYNKLSIPQLGNLPRTITKVLHLLCIKAVRLVPVGVLTLGRQNSSNYFSRSFNAERCRIYKAQRGQNQLGHTDRSYPFSCLRCRSLIYIQLAESRSRVHSL